MKEQNKQLQLTKGQNKLLQEVNQWFEQDINRMNQFKTIMGYSGTGKSSLLDFIVDLSKTKHMNPVVTATTNKAVKVLLERIDHNRFMTIHSLLNIKPKRKADKEYFEPIKYGKKENISVFDLVIIDECSMVSKKLLNYVEEEAEKNSHIRFLFCGDPAQLEPINEDISKTFSFSFDTKLTKVVRHGDVISNTAKQVRSTNKVIPIKNLIHPPVMDYIELVDLFKQFKNFRLNPNRIRLACWTNEAVKKWNMILRQVDYGYKPDQPFISGDIIMANELCQSGGNIIMNNSEEGVIGFVSEHKKYYKLQIEKELGGTAICHVLKQEFEKDYKNELKGYAKDKNWGAFWSLKDFYHDIRHCYCLTTHKLQGSSFQNIAIDIENIYLNGDIGNRNQLLYVAMTRSTDNVWFLR